MSSLLDVIQAEVKDDKKAVRGIVEGLSHWGNYDWQREKERKIFLTTALIMGPILWIYLVDFIFISMLDNAVLTRSSLAAMVVCLAIISVLCFSLRLLYFEFKTQLLLWQIMSIMASYNHNYTNLDRTVKRVEKQLDKYWRIK